MDSVIAPPLNGLLYAILLIPCFFNTPFNNSIVLLLAEITSSVPISISNGWIQEAPCISIDNFILLFLIVSIISSLNKSSL